MIFQIDSNSPKPAYLQLIDQVKYAVAAGRLRAGDRLPPIRDAAAQTRVNRNTVARAYLELEREGVIRSRAGQGSFIREDGAADVSRARARATLAEKFDEILAQARQFQMSEDDVMKILRERLGKVELRRNDER